MEGLLCEGMSLSLSGAFKQMVNDHFPGTLMNEKVNEAFLEDHKWQNQKTSLH